MNPKDHYAYFSELINKVVDRESQTSTSLYIKNVYENTVLDSTIGVWNDTRKNIISYLVVAEDSFLNRFVSDEIIGHLALSEWEKYASLANLAFVRLQEEKKMKQREKASEAKSGGEFLKSCKYSSKFHYPFWQ